MNPTAYIETSVASYLTARPSRDVVVLEVLEGVALLNASRDSDDLARLLLEFGAVPRKAAADAAHIAIAAANGVEYLVTWNFRHIANAAMRVRIENACRQAGYEPPVICTPNELMETDHADDADRHDHR